MVITENQSGVRDIYRLTDDQIALDAVRFLRSKGCTLADFNFLNGYLELVDSAEHLQAATKALNDLRQLTQEYGRGGLN